MKKIFTIATLVTSVVTSVSVNAQSFQLVNNLYSETESLLYDYDAGMTYFNGKLYFNTYYGDIAISDGTSAGTQIISDLGMKHMTAMSSNGKNRFVPLNNKLYYVDKNAKICVTDGTTSGTQIVIDINPVDEFGIYGVKYILGANSTKIFFLGNDGTNGNRLYVSDGTASGTSVIANTIYTLNTGTIVGDKIYFFGSQGTSGLEAWVSDGTESGTFILVDSNPSANQGITVYDQNFYEFNGKVYFTAVGGIYRTDGTTAGTELTITGASNLEKIISSICVYDNSLYFEQISGIDGKKWIVKSTDGTDATKSPITIVTGGLQRGLQVINNELYCRNRNEGAPTTEDYIVKINGNQLDSLSRNTTGLFHNLFQLIHPIDNGFLYIGNYYDHGIYMYKNGTNILANTNFTNVYDNLISTPIGIFAIGTNDEHGYELWKWDNEGEVVGIETIEQNETLLLFPNPTNDIIQLVSNKPMNAQITNAIGATVGIYSLNEGSNQLDLTNLSSGIYLLTTDNGNQYKITKN